MKQMTRERPLRHGWRRATSPMGRGKREKGVYMVLMLVSFCLLCGFAGGLERDLLGLGAGVAGMAGSLGAFALFGKLSGVMR